MGAFSRYIYWQLYSRLRARELWYSRDGLKLVSIRGWPTTNGDYYFNGKAEFETIEFLTAYLAPGDLFVDVGAFTGSYSIQLAHKTGVEVIAFEPWSEACQVLMHLVKVNELADKVDVRNMSLGEKDQRVGFRIDHNFNNYVLPPTAIETAPDRIENVRMTTLDSVCQTVPTAIKVDVEGYEYGVLLGGMNTLSNPALDIICIETMGLGEKYGWSDHKVINELRRFGFQKVAYDPNVRQVRLSDVSTGMTIMVKNVGSVNDRLNRTLH